MKTVFGWVVGLLVVIGGGVGIASTFPVSHFGTLTGTVEYIGVNQDPIPATVFLYPPSRHPDLYMVVCGSLQNGPSSSTSCNIPSMHSHTEILVPKSGQFTATVPVGSYDVLGQSPDYRFQQNELPCEGGNVYVGPGAVVDVTVKCGPFPGGL